MEMFRVGMIWSNWKGSCDHPLDDQKNDKKIL